MTVAIETAVDDAVTNAFVRRDFNEVKRLALAASDAPGDRMAAARELLDIARWLQGEAGSLDAAIAIRVRALELFAGGHPDPRLIAVEIAALAELFDAKGESATAAQLTKVAADLTRTCEGNDSGAYHERLQQFADRMARHGDEETSEAARDEADTLAKKYNPDRQRYGTFSLDAERPETTSGQLAKFQVPIYYATNRNIRKTTDIYARFGGERNDEVNYGVARVSVPRNRLAGTLALPSYFWQFYEGYESDSLFLLKGLNGLPHRSAWLERLREQVRMDGRREILLYVHGFNTEFWEAMLRAAQLHVDLRITGATVAYSWPSRGSSRAYDVDRTSIDVYWPQLKDLIVELARPFTPPSGGSMLAPKLIIVAHSMGCDYTLKALDRLRLDWTNGKLWNGGDSPISEIIFASPDVDLTVFKREVSPIAALTSRVTAYCSEADVALWLSKTKVHRYERAGRKAEALVGLGIDGIDTTTAAGSLVWDFAHNDYASTALLDVKAILCGDAVEQRVHLEPARISAGLYWGLMPSKLATPEGKAFAASVDSRRGAPKLPVPFTA